MLPIIWGQLTLPDSKARNAQANAAVRAADSGPDSRQRQSSPAPPVAARPASLASGPAAAAGRRLASAAPPVYAEEPAAATRSGSPAVSSRGGGDSERGIAGGGGGRKAAAGQQREGTQHGCVDSGEGCAPDQAHAIVEVDRRCPDLSGGDARVRLSFPLEQPPARNTVLAAHGLASLEGVTSHRSAPWWLA